MNRKIIIVILSLCLIIGIGVAGTVMMTGGSDAVGCEVEFSADTVTLYLAVDGESCTDFAVSSLPSPVTVSEEISGADGSIWYGLTGDSWHDIIGDYVYIKSADCTLIEKVEEESIEAVELNDGDIVINSEDTQLDAEVVDGSKLNEIENGLSIPLADDGITRETYCFDIHPENEESTEKTTVSVSGIAQPGSTVKVYHMYDEDDYTQYEILDCTVKDDGTVTFETSSFSEFYFTVDFHNGDKTYSIGGMSSVLLSEVFTELEIDENALDATRVVFSDPYLLSVEQQEDGDWLLTSLAAFSTEETLTITFSDGHQYVMTVTDQDAVKQQSTDAQVNLGKDGLYTRYQLFGTHYNEGVAIYYDYQSGTHPTDTVNIHLYNANGTEIASSSANTSYRYGQWFRFISPHNVYWFYIHDKSNCDLSYDVTDGNQQNISVSTPIKYGLRSKKSFNVTLYPMLINSDNGYCTIRIANGLSKPSTGVAIRNVQLQVYNYDTGKYDIVNTYTGIKFPTRNGTSNDATMSGSDISVSVNSSQYAEATVEISGDTYIVKLNPKTATVTAKVETSTAGTDGGNGISNVRLQNGFYNKDVSGTNSTSARFLVNTTATVTATVKDGYTFVGWYTDQNCTNLKSSNPSFTYNVDSQSDVTLYARAVKTSPLYIDCYWFAGNGLYKGLAYDMTNNSESYRIDLTGAGITNNYINNKNWYIVEGHSLIGDGTKQRTVSIPATLDKTYSDTSAWVIGTGNASDTFYGSTAKYYYGVYAAQNAKFWKAGVGLNIASLSYVRYDASNLVWEYAYTWKYSTWTYDFMSRTWNEHQHTVSFPANPLDNSVPIPADPGRVNFIYKQDPEKGTNNYYLRYYANGLNVENVPSMQSEEGLAYGSYWFTVDGLSSTDVQPTRTGYTFVGWSTNRFHDPSDTDSDDIWTPSKFQSAQYGGDNYAKYCQIEVNANTQITPKRLYAIWDKNSNDITVTYHWNDGRTDDTYKTLTYTKGHYLNLIDKPDDPTRDGYTFAGWYYDEDCNEDSAVKWVDVTDNKLYGDTEVYARWTVNITGQSMKALGDKYGEYTDARGGIEEIKITDSEVNGTSKYVTGKKITGVYDAYENFQMEAVVKDGYRFVGWYDSDEIDSTGKPTGKQVGTDRILKGKATENTTYYAYAVEESELAIDYYVRLSNGRFLYASEWQGNRWVFGVEVSKGYTNNRNWYLVAQHGLIDGNTREGTVDRKYKDDTYAMLIGTNNPEDTYYSDYTGFSSSFYKGLTKGHYDFSYYNYTESDGSITKIPFKRAGVGLDLVSLDNVYYDASMKSSGATLGGQTWKYGYQWTTSYWTYSIKDGWVKKQLRWELEDIPIYEDEGRVNFVYEKETKAGNNSFTLKYESNLGSDWYVNKIPDDASMNNIDETSYWFGISGLASKSMQPTAVSKTLSKTATFVGWSTNPQHNPDDANGLYTPAKYKESLDYRQIEVKLADGSNKGEVTLYAIWEITSPDQDENVTLTFDLNYLDEDSSTGTSDDDNKYNPDVSNVWKEVTVEKGTCVDLKGAEPTRDGYVFAGWYSSRSCSAGTEFDVANTPIYNDGTVYAKWLPKYTVHYYLEGTTTPLSADKTGNGMEIGSTVTENAISIVNYIVVGDEAKTLTIGNDCKDNVIIFYYTQAEANYKTECYVMDTDGTYGETATYTETGKANINSTVTASTEPSYWIKDGTDGAFKFDSGNANNLTSATVRSGGETVLKVYLSRNQYSLTWTVTKDDDSSYEETETVIYYYGQAVTKEDITAPDHYDFDNWAKGGVEWPKTMPMNNVDIAGELIRQRTDLVIQKTGMQNGETAIFTVKGKGLGDKGLTVMVQNGKSVTVKGLAVGEQYTVSEGGWSWKYEVQQDVTRTLTKDTTENISFANIAKIVKWLTDEFFTDNRFGAFGA